MMRNFLDTPLGAYLFSLIMIFIIVVGGTETVTWETIELAFVGSAFFAVVGMMFIPIFTALIP